MYKNYLFDLYGTLVDINTNEGKPYLWNKLSEIYSFNGADYTANMLKCAYFKEVAAEKASVKAQHPDFTYIDVQLEHVFSRLYKNKGVYAGTPLILHTAQFFRAISTKYIKLYDGALDLLLSLKEKQKKVYLLTNAQRCFTVPELKLLGVYDLFDGIVISSDELTCKPDGEFYETIINRYHLDKQETIMIGNDYITDIKGSYDAGIDSLYIHSNLSPEVEGTLYSKYSVMDSDVTKIKSLIIKSVSPK